MDVSAARPASPDGCRSTCSELFIEFSIEDCEFCSSDLKVKFLNTSVSVVTVSKCRAIRNAPELGRTRQVLCLE